MNEGRRRGFLEQPGIGRTEVTERGLVLGRGLGADIWSANPSASRRQALVYRDSTGIWLQPISSARTTVNGAAPDDVFVLQAGDILACAGVGLVVLDVGIAGKATASSAAALPIRVELQPLPPAGGQLTVHTAEHSRTAWVSGVQFDFLQVLLRPPDGRRVYDGVPDGAVLPAVWGRALPSDPGAVATLAKRLRSDLSRSGLDGRALIERTSGRTWFRLAKNARVEVLPPR